MKIDEKFLLSKDIELPHGWGHNCPARVSASSANMKQITDTIFTFTEYNLLPVDGRSLDGHYAFYVDAKNFNYVVCQDSYYGSLTYTTPAKEKGWAVLNKKDIPYVEAIIADKLLGAYYLRVRENPNWKPLFEDGCQGSIICELDGNIWKIEERDESAIGVLEKKKNG